MTVSSKADAQELVRRGMVQLNKALELVLRAVGELDNICTKSEEAGVDPKALMMGPLAEQYAALLDSAEDTVMALEEVGLYDPTGEDDDDSDDTEDDEFDVNMGDDDAEAEDDDE